jgi:hypothetical protein
MENMYYIGLDVHKRKISYCVKDGSGKLHVEGSISATRLDLDHWVKTLPQPLSAAMEATMFGGWIYDVRVQPVVLTRDPVRRTCGLLTFSTPRRPHSVGRSSSTSQFRSQALPN